MTAPTAAAAPPVGWRRPLGPDDRFTFALPGGWCRLRLTDRAQLRHDVRALVDELTAGRPDAHVLGPALAAQLEAAASRSRAAAALEVHLSTGRDGGPPLACALTVSVLPQPTGPPAGRAGASAVVQHVLPAPDGRAVLLTASTPQVALRPSLARVVEAVAGSLRWLA